MIRFLASKIAGPALIYAVLALFVSNAVTGCLLKQAYDAKVKARLECNNEKLQEALQAQEAVTAALEVARQERESERQKRIAAEIEADKKIADRVAGLEEKHASELEQLQLTLSAIPDEDYQCASADVSADVAQWMRRRADSHNQNRADRSTEGNPVTGSGSSP